MEINASDVKEMLFKISEEMIDNEKYLCEVDSYIGDGDHGHTMARSFKAARQSLQKTEEETIDSLFKIVANSLISKGGGASGPLFGTIFLNFATSVSSKEKLGLTEFANMFTAACKGVKERGKVSEGEKTMVDALSPAAQAFKIVKKEGGQLIEATKKARQAAKRGVEKTKELEAKKGRAKFTKERAEGYQDAGATSVYLIVKAIEEFLTEKEESDNA